MNLLKLFYGTREEKRGKECMMKVCYTATKDVRIVCMLRAMNRYSTTTI
jgi:hypothetical protein